MAAENVKLVTRLSQSLLVPVYRMSELALLAFIPGKGQTLKDVRLFSRWHGYFSFEPLLFIAYSNGEVAIFHELMYRAISNSIQLQK